MPKFEGKIKSKKLKEWLEAVHAVSDEVPVVVKQDGVYVKAIDPAHVAMVESSVATKVFDEYKLDTEFTFGLDVEKAKNVLKGLKGEYISIAVQNDDIGGCVAFSANGSRVAMKIVDHTTMSDAKIPVLDLPCKFKTNKKMFVDFFKIAEEISDVMRLTTTDQEMKLDAHRGYDTSNDRENASTSVNYTERISIRDAKSLYSMDYLQKFVKKSVSDELKISLGTDFPILIESNDWGVCVKYLLAHQIETDDAPAKTEECTPEAAEETIEEPETPNAPAPPTSEAVAAVTT